MYIDAYAVIGVLAGALIFIAQLALGWFLKSLFERIRQLEEKDGELLKQIQVLAIALPTNYTAKEDFKELGDNIFSALRRIEEKLDHKEDKK